MLFKRQLMQTPKNLIQISIASSLLCLFLASCATNKYEAKPLNVKKITSNLLAKDVRNSDFKAYLVKQGYKEDSLPFSTWGLDELTLCALYFNPKLDVSKAQLGLANAQIDSAGQKQSPTLNANIAHSDLANGDKRPWAYGLNVEIPIETVNKREIKIEETQANATVSRMDIAATAWQLRSQIAQHLIDYQQNLADTQLLQNQLKTQAEILKMLEKRLDKGLAAKTELDIVQLAQLKTQSELNSGEAKSVEIQAKLASDVGLSLEKFKQLDIKPLDVETTLSQQTSVLDADFVNKHLQEHALLNRIDIRRALAKYAATEAKIKLEIAKQTPDISMSPGIAFEYGDSIWSLGFSTLLGLANKNTTFINEAKQLREIEGAQVEALQAQIIGDLNQAYASYVAEKQNLNQAQSQHKGQLHHAQKLQKQFDAGLIDRLELRQASLALIISQQQVLNAQFMLLNVANNIENIIQRPIYNAFQLPNE